MRAIGTALTLLLVTACRQAAAQAPADAMKTFVSSSDVAALIAKAKSERKANQPIVAQPLLKLAPYTASLEYRASVGPAARSVKEVKDTASAISRIVFI